VKTFIFEFINSYTSLFYIAFFKNGTELWGETRLRDQCNIGDARENASGCIDELTVQLAVILGTNIVIGQTREVVLPWLVKNWKRISNLIRPKQEEIVKPPWEAEDAMLPYCGLRKEYEELGLLLNFHQANFIQLFNMDSSCCLLPHSH
jgi:hypothetical protein